MDYLKVAKEYTDNGLSIIPLGDNKTPINKWAKYQKDIIQPDDTFKNCTSIGLVCGNVSGNIECLDIDCKYDLDGNLFDKYKRLIKYSDRDLLQKMVVQSTINGGYHFIYKCKTIEGNQKLASRPDDESGSKVLIETRGEGGYILIAPSDGYKIIYGDLSKINEITEEERETLFSCAVSLNQIEEFIYIDKNKINFINEGGLSPIDDYNNRGDVLGLLSEHGWSQLEEKGGRVILRRPGKKSGISGDWHIQKKIFKVFTTSTIFINDKGYSAFGVYAVLECNGDYSKAVKELYELGFGDKVKRIEANKKTIIKIENPEINVYDRISTKDEEKEYLDSWRNNTFKLGLSTGYDEFDTYFRFKEASLNWINGHANIGKSTMIWYWAVLSNILHGWKWIIHAGENSESSVRRQLMEFKTGKGLRYIQNYDEVLKWSYSNFDIIKNDIDYSANDLLEYCRKLMEVKEYKGMLIDPYNSLSMDAEKLKNMTSHDYHYEIASDIRRFAKNNNIATFVNSHAVTMSLRNTDNSGNIKAPSAGDTEGGSKFYNRSDNFITLHRNIYDRDDNNFTYVHIRKIKEKETGGEPTSFANPLKFEMTVRDKFFGFWLDGKNPIYDLNNGKIIQKNIYEPNENKPEPDRICPF